ncbi:MAG: hypothetical protein JWN15_4385 [Firmicutes bacterium]|nr:hypothetical protein [Bacillota bacterium]
MAIASLILGIIGSVTGIGALAWQVITWNRSGPVVKVTASQGFPVYGDDLGEQITIVTAENSGRSPVTITSWGLRFRDGQVMVIRRPLPSSDPIPHRLEAGASGSWHFETVALAETCKAHGVNYEDLTAYVKLGNGKTIDASRKGILLGPGFPWQPSGA